MQDTFFTSVGCMDGRIQDVIEEYSRKLFNALYHDTITEPGFVGVFVKRSVSNRAKWEVEEVR